jgi:hypothetical protein
MAKNFEKLIFGGLHEKIIMDWEGSGVLDESYFRGLHSVASVD